MTAPLTDIQQKTVIVTGGARGIGRAIALKFLQCGARVVIADVEEIGAATARELGEEGYAAQIYFVRCDISLRSDVEALVAETVRLFGPVDILVNNAGIFPRSDMLQMDEAFWDHVLDVNLKGTFMMCQTVVPGMIDRSSGAIINIGSNHANAGEAATLAYAVSKGGLVTLTRNLAKSLAQHRIRVNCVQPGWIASEGEVARWKSVGMDEANIAATMSRFGLGRLQTGEDIADAVLFMASNMSSQITGQTLVVDGGSSVR
ncbi:3-oxoacyl-[acyl-carrier protein] reductase/2-hydroxycyclohexanecarboxyl-CoA dehydrogenase [Paenibacillus taihuensis]|uniref:3-oxoacyl-[acyl-carrier protein] reductase/2-hydroxycyclohexanecarboxyl-CoA dehydrogenase n=1 Tax=Paenibacillus taihuensis TaxID=1156355 RepID=A0A3D9SE54_9BACL|nr:SDR family NAD(P)-dependent oxidoreductase [Paenibacillus taihuensis]REE93132.1 3-oxoacyl-[acyl-carrier protein] reductase/2-hydroxycyclohexanecarboxyl-CoA dehydrogenase [Paenibacillus taihuensis]